MSEGPLFHLESLKVPLCAIRSASAKGATGETGVTGGAGEAGEAREGKKTGEGSREGGRAFTTECWQRGSLVHLDVVVLRVLGAGDIAWRSLDAEYTAHTAEPTGRGGVLPEARAARNFGSKNHSPTYRACRKCDGPLLDANTSKGGKTSTRSVNCCPRCGEVGTSTTRLRMGLVVRGVTASPQDTVLLLSSHETTARILMALTPPEKGQTRGVLSRDQLVGGLALLERRVELRCVVDALADRSVARDGGEGGEGGQEQGGGRDREAGGGGEGGGGWPGPWAARLTILDIATRVDEWLPASQAESGASTRRQ
jgi:hypothetical protein